MAVGDELQLTGGLTDSAGAMFSTRSLIWLSSNPDIATVSSGYVRALRPGTTTITVSDSGFSASTPISVLSQPLAFISLSAGDEVTCGVERGGTLYCWGWGHPNAFPVSPELQVSAVHVHAGDRVCAITTDSARYCPVPTLMPGGLKYRAMAGVCSLTADDRLYCDTGYPTVLPTLVQTGLRFKSIARGDWHYCALSEDDEAYCWGENVYGALGTGDTVDAQLPVKVVGGLKFIQLAASYQVTCGIAYSGGTYCWGLNKEGQLGRTPSPDYTPNPRPEGAPRAPEFASLSARGVETCGVGLDGIVSCWGTRTGGSILPVAASVKFVSVAVGHLHDCALTAGGGAYCWGANNGGQLGDGTSISRPVPVHVLGSAR